MERFKRATSTRYTPIAHLQTTLECDAAVRTATPHHTLLSLLSPLTQSALSHNTVIPPLWPDILNQLSDSLQSPQSLQSLVTSYAAALEAVTAIASYDHLTTPLAIFLCAWVCEQSLSNSLANLALRAEKNQPQGTASFSSPLPKPRPRILLVCRADSRQDDAARSAAVAQAAAEYGEDRVHVVMLGAKAGDETPEAVGKMIDLIVQEELNAAISAVSKEADRLRKASRTFRSWFSGAAVRRPEIEKGGGGEGGNRLSIGGGVTPLFPGDSLEARTKHLADLYMLARRYGDALECYRLLQGDLRTLAGLSLVHEGAAHEMSALAVALVDGSKQEVGSAIERAIQMYCRAGRRELAVRATIRGVAFCMEAGYPDSAAGVITRAIDAILPRGIPFGGSMSPSGGAFVESAVAVLYTACAEAYVKLRKKRRASLFAFSAASRFTKAKFHAAAACVALGIDEAALLRKGVRNDIELIMGAAESVQGRYAKAVSHFVRVLAGADERTDAEVQGAAIQGFLDAAAKGAGDTSKKRWDSGESFPLIHTNLAKITTYDSSNGDHEMWTALEDDVLEDYEFFASLSKAQPQTPLPKRERRLESVIAELRKRKERGGSRDPGGSIEMKIKRMRELAESKKKRRRARSLLGRGAIVGERIRLHIVFNNPLLFPVFISSLSAVVSVDGQSCFSKDYRDEDEGRENQSDNDPVTFIPADDVTLVPHSSQTVVLEVVSNKPCSLKFLGARWDFTIGMGGASPKARASITVPGFCLLERRGRRLNATRKQRASEVPLYEKDESLTAKVVPLEPRLKATVLSSDAEFENRLESLVLRAGETRKAKLSLRNEGEVPLGDVVIRIGTPQTLFLDVYPEGACNRQELVSALGIDDQLAEPNEVIVASRTSVNLRPKESTEITLLLRAAVSNAAFGYGSGARKQGKKKQKRMNEADAINEDMLPCDLRLIIAYGNQSIRVSRVSAQFGVRPSILVSPRFLRPADADVLPYGKSRGVLLGLEVEHGGQSLFENLVFRVTQVNITSRSAWRPASLQEPTECLGDVSDEVDHPNWSLRVNETATVFFLVVRESDMSPDEKESETEIDEPWQTSRIDLFERRTVREQGKSSGNNDVAERRDGHSAIGPTQRLDQRASTHFVVCAHSCTHVPASPLKSMSSELIYISLVWSSLSGLKGEIHIPPIDPLKWMKRGAFSSAGTSHAFMSSQEITATVGKLVPAIPGSSPVEEDTNMPPPQEGDWISCKVHHPSALEHSFFGKEDNPSHMADGTVVTPIPVTVPVDVYVRNIGPYLLDVVFAAPTTGGIGDGARGRYWAGDMAMSLRAIPPGAERILKLTAVLISSGRYNMSDFTVMFQTCGYSSGSIRKQVFLKPSYLNVTDRTCLDMTAIGVDLPSALNANAPGSEKCDSGLPEKSGESESTEEKIKKVTGEVKKLVLSGKEEEGRTEQKRLQYHDSKRIKSESTSNMAIVSERKNRMSPLHPSPAAAVVRSANQRSRSEPPVRKTMGISRAISDGSGTRLFKGSADDAFWNASDTDESEEGKSGIDEA